MRRVPAETLNARKGTSAFRYATNRTAFQSYTAKLRLHFVGRPNISARFYLHQLHDNSARFDYVLRISSIQEAIQPNLHSTPGFEILWLAKN